MAVFYGTGNLPGFNNPVLTIGTFDGVHKGHQAILQDVVQHARKANGESILITFEPHPRKLIYPDQSLQLLTTLDEKIALVKATGIDHVVVVPFDEAFSSLTAEAYIQDFLVSKFHPHAIVIGYDHRFGHDRRGDLELLKTFTAANHFDLYELPAQKIDDAAVSSTKIRSALKAGEVDIARSMLGRNYELSGMVVHGAKVGRQLGYPTANLEPLSEDQLIPGKGAYAVTVKHNETEYAGMLNIGIRPTVSSELKLHIEAHLFEFNGDLYDQQITLGFVARLRGERKFESLDALKEQLGKDAENARTILQSPRQ